MDKQGDFKHVQAIKNIVFCVAKQSSLSYMRRGSGGKVWTSFIMVRDGKNFPSNHGIYRTAERHTPQDNKLNIHRFENLKSCNYKQIY